MEEKEPIRILLVEDNHEFANLVQLFLRKSEKKGFEIVWKTNGKDALEELQKTREYHVILMDYFLPGQNGVEVTKAIQAMGLDVPVVFLTVNKDFDLAVEVMKLGVEDYLVKEEITTPVLPKTLFSVVERKKLRDQLTTLEVSQKRLEAIQEMVGQISGQIRVPLEAMKASAEELAKRHPSDKWTTYVTIIKDNVDRIEQRLVRLKDLKSVRTVTYVRDIQMLDLSEEEGGGKE